MMNRKEEIIIAALQLAAEKGLRILTTLNIEYYVISQDMTASEFAALFSSAGWHCPTEEQMRLAITNSTKSYVVRYKGNAVATINWLGDYGMHWFMKELIVHTDFQGRMIGTFLYRFSENYIKSVMLNDWKVCIDLRSSKGKEAFYRSLGFDAMKENETGSGMEKMVKNVCIH